MSTDTVTREALEEAKRSIKRQVMLTMGDHFGTALVGVEVSDEDARRYLAGATLDDLLRAR